MQLTVIGVATTGIRGMRLRPTTDDRCRLVCDWGAVSCRAGGVIGRMSTTARQTSVPVNVSACQRQCCYCILPQLPHLRHQPPVCNWESPHPPVDIRQCMAFPAVRLLREIEKRLAISPPLYCTLRASFNRKPIGYEGTGGKG